MPYNSSPARAHRQAHRNFLLPSRGSREQKVGQIGAGDKQHDAGNGHQGPERRPELGPHIGAPLRAWQDVNGAFEELFLRICRRVRKRRLAHFHLEHGMHERLERRFRFLKRHARLQAPEGIHPSIAAVLEHFHWDNQRLFLHRDWDKDLRRESQFHAVKARLGDADNGHGVFVNGQGFSENARVAAEPLPPVIVTQHHKG